MRGLNKFLRNKNTVTILGIIVIVFLLFIGFNTTINSTVNPVSVPVANKKILPSTQITKDDVKFIQVSKIVLSDNVVTNLGDIILKYTNINTTIPENSMFYKEALISGDELPGNWLNNVDFENGEEPYYYDVDISSTYGNSIVPNSYIDIFMAATLNERKHLMYGKLFKNLKVLAVHDRKKKNVFDNSEEVGVPKHLIIALSQDNYNLLVRAQYSEKYLENEDVVLTIVPHGTNLPAGDNAVRVNRATLMDYINVASSSISNDQLQE